MSTATAVTLSLTGQIQHQGTRRTSVAALLTTELMNQGGPGFFLQLSVIAMDSRTQCRFYRLALPQFPQNSKHVTHSVVVTNVAHGGQRFQIDDVGLRVGEAGK